ncbi:MAG: type II toxin-antitoxin system HigB family toxin [Flavobacteriales bacterium]|nr:type II toxin-antitoxin system HigB family toxin [Flavobacteriales bacterium]MCB9166831.1 type II toxin-antitoxin system HigB family toxin [Flavobacteriales bacterium]MCB9170532.1 type II toxin-antitoxin system HigB family toxin [Flavobacteriales bacterium]MCB9193182.1 type II toxin-antitoxin system HigB family toxin [Flavobacteriales bacterium]
MRIIKRKTLLDFAAKHPPARQPLLAWYAEVTRAAWSRPNDIKTSFRTADIIDTKRVVFNIKGNSFRLIADVEYRIGLVFIVRVMTHAEYDKVDVNTIHYDG